MLATARATTVALAMCFAPSYQVYSNTKRIGVLMKPLDFGEEVRLTDSNTGGQKGSKLARLDLIPVYAQVEEAKVHGMGATKYAPYNWRKGYNWSLSYAALQRHLVAFWNGEDTDPESGLPHLAHARWHTGTLLEFLHYGLGTDDRLSTLVAEAERELELASAVEGVRN